MPILSGDIKLVASQVMDDVSEGGGAPTANVIADGVSNAIFPDISELDRAGGRVNLRKLHVSVQTADTATYMGSNMIVAEPPEDPLVSVTLFTTDSTFDRRVEAASRIESYLNKGPEWQGYLYENHIAGQRVVQFFQRPNTALPAVGQTLTLIENEGLVTQKEQYIRAIEVSYVEQTFTYESGGPKDYKAWVVTVATSDALRFDFIGSPPSPYFYRTASQGSTTLAPNNTKVRDTVVADAGTYVGVVPLAQTAALGAFTVFAETVYTQLVPSAQTETPLADVNPIQQSTGYVPTGGTLSMALTLAFTTAQSLFIGGAIYPGSLSIVRGGITLTDTGGLLYSGGSEVGQVDYENGIVRLSSDVFGTESGTQTISYTPAAVPRVVGASVHFDITAQSRSLSYVHTLEVPPAPGSFMLSYQVAKRWYVLRDDGTGKVLGSSTSYGAGTINYTTGTVSLTLGALPDVDSILLYQWTPGLMLAELDAVAWNADGRFYDAFSTDQAIEPGTLTLTWNDGTARTATSSGNSLVGDATGGYNGNDITFSPNVIPAGGTPVTAIYTGRTLSFSDEVQSLLGVLDGTDWVYTLPAGLSDTGQEIWLDEVYVDCKTTRVNGVWSDALRALRLNFKILGNVIYASNNVGPVTALGTVNWANNTFRLPSGSFNKTAFFDDYVDVAGVLSRTVAYGDVPCSIKPDGTLPSTRSIRVFTTTTTPDQTSVFAVGSFKLSSVVASPGNVSVQAVSFKLNGVVHRQGNADTTSDKIYSNILGTSGVGTEVGSISGLGVISLSAIAAGTANTVTDLAGVWAPPTPGVTSPYWVTKLSFRTATSPLRPSSVTVLANNQAGALLTGTSNEAGELTGGITGLVDYENGLIKLSGAQTLDATSIRYNAVAYSYLPLDADLLGIDPVRLPSDGRVPIFRAGGFAVVGHTGKITATVSNAQTIDCARVRLSRVRVVGFDGSVINTGYTTDLEAGTVTFTDVTGYSQPVTIEHRIEDMGVVREAQISGEVTFTRALTHAYPLGSYLSSALVAGDLKSRVSVLFDQVTWTNVWSDALIGTAATGTYNDVLAPIVVTNTGAVTERWALIFTSTTAFNLVGEHVGVIATGNINEALAPVNPATGAPYFTIPALGWGLGWATGNVLRFNTVGAMAPVWVVRTVQQGPNTGIQHSFTLLSRGDVDRV